MPKKILLIENDQALLAQLSDTLEATGFEVRSTGDGKEGLDLARDWAPEAVVLCVELPGMSGYLVCQKLKKDDAVKGIPLVLTSAEATEETFEKHKTLKARADEYLLKPYDPAALVDKLAALVGLPEGAPSGAAAEEIEEELVSLEEEIGIGAADGEPGAEVPGLDLESLPDEPAGHEASGGVDDDLRLLDDAFDGLSAPAAGAQEAAAALDELTGERPMAGEDVDAAAASLPDEDEGAARAALGGLDAEADAALGALSGDDETLSPGLSLGGDEPLPSGEEEPVPVAAAVSASSASARPLRGATADLLRAAGIKLLDDEPARERAAVPPPPEPSFAAGAEAGASPRLQRELDEARAALDRLREEASSKDGELRDLRRKIESLGRRADDAEGALGEAKARADAAQEKLRKAEADAKAGREDARRAEADLADVRKRATDAEKRVGQLEPRLEELEIRAAAAEEDARRKSEEAAAAAESVARAEALEREADELRTELLVARGEAEGARGEVEKRTADLRKRVGDLEATNAKNEERVVKAYQKIKADEKVRDKVRKAIAIAAQLLEEGLPAESSDKDRRASAARE